MGSPPARGPPTAQRAGALRTSQSARESRARAVLAALLLLLLPLLLIPLKLSSRRTWRTNRPCLDHQAAQRGCASGLGLQAVRRARNTIDSTTTAKGRRPRPLPSPHPIAPLCGKEKNLDG